MKLVITGANGFIGQALCLSAVRRGWSARAITRRPVAFSSGIENQVMPDYSDAMKLAQAFAGHDVLIHLAAAAHLGKEKEQDHLQTYAHRNVEITKCVVQAALHAQVKRLVYVSSAGVHGVCTQSGQVLSEASSVQPHDAYTASKLECEQVLRGLAADTSMDIVVVRPPLVYGAKATGSFAQLLRFVRSGYPLPFAAVGNLRDFVAVENLCSALLECAVHPRAVGETFLVTDGQALSTAQVLSCVAQGMGQPDRLFSLPLPVLRVLARVLGKTEPVNRLLCSLQIDSSHIRQTLDWTAPLTAREALVAAGRAYQKLG